MKEIVIAIIAIAGTVSSYFLAKSLYKRINHPLLLPITVATALIVGILLSFNVTYETYMIGGKWIHALLGAAVVSLAYPLYEQRTLLKSLALPVLFGCFLGAIIGITTGVALANFFNMDEQLVYSILPKSVTTPVAMDISESIGGVSSLAAAFVIVAGVSGAMISEFLFRIFRIRGNVGRGVALGSASHAIGTAKAFENNHLEGSVSTIAMIVSAIFVSILTPFLLQLFM